MSTYTQNIGDVVVCDFCNDDGKLSKGGVLIGSNAVCGKCSQKNGYYKSDYEYRHEISRFFDKRKLFQKNVLEYRKEAYGSSDGIIQISSWDDFMAGFDGD